MKAIERYRLSLPAEPRKRASAVVVAFAANALVALAKSLAGVTIAGERTQTELAYVLRDVEQRLRRNDAVGLAFLTLSSPEEEEVRV
jgi:hypothetical protein